MFIRKIPITIFSLMLISSLATGTASAKSNETINYVALGDSLAAGQMPTELGVTGYNGTSYADIISEKLAGKGDVNYNNYGESGNTIGNVLFSVAFDTEQIAAIQKADIITLDIGANDLLSLVRMDDEKLSALPEGALVGYLDAMLSMANNQADIHLQLQEIYGAIPFIASSVAGAVSEIQNIDMSDETQDAQIYVMGYYNAFSFLTDLGVSQANEEKIPLLQAELANMVQYYNSSLQTELSSMEGVTYVDSYDSMDNHLEKYLPIDIHPTVQGYRAIAKAFLDAME